MPHLGGYAMWVPGEFEYLLECCKQSYNIQEAVGLFQKKFPHRNLNMVRKKFYSEARQYSVLFKKKDQTSVVEQLEMRDKLKELTRELDGLREEVRSTKELEELIHGVASQDFTKLPRWNVTKDIRGLTGRPFLLLSDIHHGEVVQSAQINYTNKFDRAISAERLEYTFKLAVELPLTRFNNPKYDGFVCALNGDIISGNIHEELAETNDGPVMDSVVEVTELLIKGITLLADSYQRVFVPCIVGNHGRIHRKPRYKNRAMDNYEWIVYHFIARHFKDDDRVHVTISDAPDIQYSIHGINFLQTHGDQFRGGTGIAGLFSPIMLGLARKQARQQAVKMPFDVMLIGHWHQYIHTEKLIINGSVKGYDEFAYGFNLPFEPPRQALFICHPRHGIIYRMPIICNGYENKEKPSSKIEVVR